MDHTTTHENAKSASRTLRILRNMPDWLIILLIVLLALTILGISLVM